MQRLKEIYLKDVVPQLNEQFNYTNPQQVPQLKKVVINRGFGENYQNVKVLESSLDELTNISGQRGIITKSKKAIASFKVREGMPVGMTVTLRGEKMYGFLDRLINLSLPRIRDFQGVSSKSFDGRGNYSLGFTDQLMFPEVDFDKINQTQGMDITVVTSCKTDEEGRALLKALGMPFKS
uniref:Large ribosomal subunit protein uL5c n=1 Tax=Eutreptiella eupharyngea TaxID=215702 RepID=A0A977K822_9EUGL|nr:ribosomal protein L5 [Eutreptiella eupharyngea]UXD06305.1 ribosomal protein L5 [Eutreptiella eupharyngea]